MNYRTIQRQQGLFRNLSSKPALPADLSQILDENVSPHAHWSTPLIIPSDISRENAQEKVFSAKLGFVGSDFFTKSMLKRLWEPFRSFHRNRAGLAVLFSRQILNGFLNCFLFYIIIFI